MKNPETRSSLSAELRKLLGKLYHIPPEQVDEEFIRKKRDELYSNPDHRFVVDSTRGGYNNEGLENQTQAEIDAERAIALEFLSQFADNE
jgi:hypothetical protein